VTGLLIHNEKSSCPLAGFSLDWIVWSPLADTVKSAGVQFCSEFTIQPCHLLDV
jgi:hypothetical protein